MASFGRPKLTSRIPGLSLEALRTAAVRDAMAASWGAVRQLAAAAVSPTRWWARITSVAGVAVLLGFSVVMLIAGLVVTWPHH